MYLDEWAMTVAVVVTVLSAWGYLARLPSLLKGATVDGRLPRLLPSSPAAADFIGSALVDVLVAAAGRYGHWPDPRTRRRRCRPVARSR